MSERISQLLESVSEVIANPAGNLTAAVFMMAAAVVITLMLIVIMMLVILPGRRRAHRRPRRSAGRAEPSTADTKDLHTVEPGNPAQGNSPLEGLLRGRIGAWVIASAVVLAVGASYAATSQDSYCLSCHSPASTVPVIVPADGDGAHADTACVSCHEDRAALLTNSVMRLSDLAARVGIAESQYTPYVTSSRCVRCHRNTLAESVTNEETGVRMSHAEPLEAGWACLDCHSGAGHSPIVVPDAMSRCITCHDAERASAECATCHTKDVSAASGLAADRIYGRATITRTDCEGCHSMESCDDCHGLRMPHPEEFLRTHPRYSGFDLKDMCYEQCHTDADCGKCHGAWSSHIPSFKEDHKRLPKDATCSTCHSKHEGPMCDLCHDFNR